jgi:hypothetical protein
VLTPKIGVVIYWNNAPFSKALLKLGSEDPRLRPTIGPISSLHEAWFHTLDTCVIDSPLSEVILSLMRNCFFGGAMHAVFLRQKGHGDQLAAYIAASSRKSHSRDAQGLTCSH